MSSVQERLQLKRVPLDKWSIQEQLCLASAVACSGDQNWMSVSRSLKMLCSSNRPGDWFSQRSCAAQYGKLLENVETPKRKKRTISERDNSGVQTPSELIVRKLTLERIAELKKITFDEQQQYLKYKEDIMAVQTADEYKLREMWNQIETENKQKEKERFQHSQWLKEREERKLEMEKAWRPGGIGIALSGSSLPRNQTINSPSSNSPIDGSQILPQLSKTPLPLKIKTEDLVDVDEPFLHTQESTTANKQKTSPLLTSLLKSPSQVPISSSTTTTTSSSNIHTSTASQNFPSIGTRKSTPTITSLLTSNLTSTTQNMDVGPSLSSASNQPDASNSSILLEPLETNAVIKMDSANLGTMEIKKEDNIIQFTDLTVESPSSNENDSIKDEDQQLMEVFNGLIPDNIDELADILTQTNAIISLSPGLLEGGGSIMGNVDSLIDSHDVAEHSSNIKESTKQEKQIEQIVEPKNEMEIIKIEDDITSEWTDEVMPVKNIQGETEKLKIDKIEDSINMEIFNKEKKLNSSNSIVSNSVIIPIQTETKIDLSESARTKDMQTGSKEESQITNYQTSEFRTTSQPPSPQSSENDIVIIEDNTPPASEHDVNIESKNYSPIDTKNDDSCSEIITKVDNKDVKNENLSDISKMMIEVFEKNNQNENKGLDFENDVKREQFDMKSEKALKNTIEIIVKSNQSSLDKSDDDTFEVNKKEIIDSKAIQDVPTSISLIDTDDDSPIEVIKEDKIGKQKRDYSRKKSENQKFEDHNNDDINKGSLNLRMKLKERDRSESPFVIDDDTDDIPRTRRRYSSTPNIDSIPNSPASSTTTNDDRDYKLWKKSILIVFNRIQIHKHSSIFLKLDEQYLNFKSILRPIDLMTIKKNIENEVIRSTVEFQRDIMLMCYNLLFLNSKMSLTVKEFLQDALHTIDSTLENTRKDEKIGTSGGSTGGSSTSSNLNQSQSSSSSLFSTSSGKGRGGRKSSRMSNV